MSAINYGYTHRSIERELFDEDGKSWGFAIIGYSHHEESGEQTVDTTAIRFDGAAVKRAKQVDEALAPKEQA